MPNSSKSDIKWSLKSSNQTLQFTSPNPSISSLISTNCMLKQLKITIITSIELKKLTSMKTPLIPSSKLSKKLQVRIKMVEDNSNFSKCSLYTFCRGISHLQPLFAHLCYRTCGPSTTPMEITYPPKTASAVQYSHLQSRRCAPLIAYAVPALLSLGRICGPFFTSAGPHLRSPLHRFSYDN